MPTRPCPKCGSTAPRYLPATSDIAVVNYYRCDDCGHVWTVKKSDSGARQVPVTRHPGDSGEGQGGGSSAAS